MPFNEMRNWLETPRVVFDGEDGMHWQEVTRRQHDIAKRLGYPDLYKIALDWYSWATENSPAYAAKKFKMLMTNFILMKRAQACFVVFSVLQVYKETRVIIIDKWRIEVFNPF